jgi:DNA-binding HxlR family transcriptional regulator
MDGAISGDRENCPVEATLRLIGGKWRMVVLFRLGDGPMRFNALQRSLAPVTQRVLTATLRGLEDDGLVWREVRETVPPHVEYGLTARGRALGPVWAEMARWQLQASGR